MVMPGHERRTPAQSFLVVMNHIMPHTPQLNSSTPESPLSFFARAVITKQLVPARLEGYRRHRQDLIPHVVRQERELDVAIGDGSTRHTDNLPEYFAYVTDMIDALHQVQNEAPGGNPLMLIPLAAREERGEAFEQEVGALLAASLRRGREE